MEHSTRPNREIVGISTVSLNEGDNRQIELLGKVEFRFKDTRYVYGRVEQLMPDRTFLRWRRNGVIEKINVGPDTRYIMGDETPIHYFEAERIWSTPDRRSAIVCAEDPVAMNIVSLAPLAEPSKQTFAMTLCDIWEIAETMEIRRVAISDDLNFLAIQRWEMSSRPILILDHEYPDSPMEAILPHENMTMEAIQNVKGQPQLLVSGYPDRKLQRAYLINFEGNIISETEMPGPIVAGSSFERILFLVGTGSLEPARNLEIKVWYPRTGEEEILEVDTRNALRELWRRR